MSQAWLYELMPTYHWLVCWELQQTDSGVSFESQSKSFHDGFNASPEIGWHLLKRGVGEVGIWRAGVGGRCSVIFVSEFRMILTGLTQGDVIPGWVVT